MTKLEPIKICFTFIYLLIYSTFVDCNLLVATEIASSKTVGAQRI